MMNKTTIYEMNKTAAKHYLLREPSLTIKFKAWVYFYYWILAREDLRRYSVIFPEKYSYPFYAADDDDDYFEIPSLKLNQANDPDEVCEFYGWVEYFYDTCLTKNTTFDITYDESKQDLIVVSKLNGRLKDLSLVGFVEFISEEIDVKFRQISKFPFHSIELFQKPVIVYGSLSLVQNCDSAHRVKSSKNKCRMNHNVNIRNYPSNTFEYGFPASNAIPFVDKIKYKMTPVVKLNYKDDIQAGEEILAHRFDDRNQQSHTNCSKWPTNGIPILYRHLNSASSSSSAVTARYI
jgi:hypothetical protein